MPTCAVPAAGFDYDISDGNGGTDTGHVAVDVSCANDAPVAVDDTGSVANNPGPTDFDVLANDTDVEGDSLNLVSASVSASAGSASVVARQGPLHAPRRVQRPRSDHLRRQRRRPYGQRHAHGHRRPGHR